MNYAKKIGTGALHPAKLCIRDRDATAVFNMLSGYSEPDRWNKLIVAPLWMKDRFLHLIAMEEEHAKKGPVSYTHLSSEIQSMISSRTEVLSS